MGHIGQCCCLCFHSLPGLLFVQQTLSDWPVIPILCGKKKHAYDHLNDHKHQEVQDIRRITASRCINCHPEHYCAGSQIQNQIKNRIHIHTGRNTQQNGHKQNGAALLGFQAIQICYGQCPCHNNKAVNRAHTFHIPVSFFVIAPTEDAENQANDTGKKQRYITPLIPY